MCGVFALIYHSGVDDTALLRSAVDTGFQRIRHRGPDSTIVRSAPLHISDDSADTTVVVLGFHRLAIMDTSTAGNQPMSIPELPGVTVVCNGEIYNWRELAEELGVTLHSKCDCEIILWMYREHGWNRQMLSMLDGYFAIVLHDINAGVVYAARDSQGVRPLFMGCGFHDGREFTAFASEMKALHPFCQTIGQFPPCVFMRFSDHETIFEQWFRLMPHGLRHFDEYSVVCGIRNLLTRAVEKRIHADRPIACLLSGGLDSSIVSALVAKKIHPRKLKTFSIGFSGAPDLLYARRVAEWIGSEHTEIVCEESEFLGVIPEVIRMIESYDTTTVRASVGNYLVAKWVSQKSDCRVLFNGDYSDELFMSYQYASRCENEHEFLLENKKLLSSIHYFDSLRSDRCISGWGLETRTPFADRALVDFVIEVDPKLKMHNKRIEKWLLRRAFADEGLIPDEVLWRPKLAFSNGVSDKNRDWKDIIKEHVDHLVSDEEFSRESQKYTTCTPVLKESYYYRKIFEQFYPGTTPIPYFWLPNQRWVGGNVADPSARVLAFNREV